MSAVANPEPGRSLFVRIALGLVATFLVIHIAGYYIYGHERMVANARTFAMSVANRAYALDNLLAQQPELLPVLQSPGFKIRRVAAMPLAERVRDWPHNDEVIDNVQRHMQALGMANAEDIRLWFLVRNGPPRLRLLLPSVNGDVLDVEARTEMNVLGYGSMVGFTMSVVLLLAVAVALLFTRRLTRQLGRFVLAAERLGAGQAGPSLPESVGPRELRRASRAFNHMQERVLSLLKERGDMLAGISHDLRTLSTRLGLRVEDIADETQRDKAQRDIALMTGILDQALTFTKDEHCEEAFGSVDLNSLLQTLADEMADVGAELAFDGAGHVVVHGQPVALSRLFHNLIDNAVKYGGSATITLSDDTVVILDPGAGFAAEQTAEALRPYTRLDGARSQVRPGTGLGLSIAQNVCRRHGWQLRFEQRANGFAAIVSFARPDTA